jgi:hypothetical protein
MSCSSCAERARLFREALLAWKAGGEAVFQAKLKEIETAGAVDDFGSFKKTLTYIISKQPRH